MELQQPCKEWTGARSPKGYGVKRYKGRSWRVHRATWDELKGPIPDGMKVLHRCDNPPCYEITHLYLGTPADNTRDMISRDRQALRGRLPQSKLTAEQVEAVRQRYAAGGVTQQQLATEYGVVQGAISYIIRNGKKTGKPRVSADTVSKIRELYESGIPQATLAQHFDLHSSSVSEIVRGLTHS